MARRRKIKKKLSKDRGKRDRTPKKTDTHETVSEIPADIGVGISRFVEEAKANSLNHQGLFEDAIESADQCISMFGPGTMSLMAKADALFRLERWDEALAVSEQQMRGEDQIEYQHADILYLMGKTEELGRFCDEWDVRTDQEDPYLWVNRGRLLLKAGDIDGAVAMAQKALDDGEAYDYACRLMADIEVARGNMAKAIEWCEEGDDGMDSTHANDMRLMKINIMRKSGDIWGARDMCSRMLAKFPRHHSFLAIMDEMSSG